MGPHKEITPHMRKITDNSLPEFAMIEHRVESSSSAENSRELRPSEKALYENGKVNLIPMPTADPRGMISPSQRITT